MNQSLREDDKVKEVMHWPIYISYHYQFKVKEYNKHTTTRRKTIDLNYTKKLGFADSSYCIYGWCYRGYNITPIHAREHHN